MKKYKNNKHKNNNINQKNIINNSDYNSKTNKMNIIMNNKNNNMNDKFFTKTKILWIIFVLAVIVIYIYVSYNSFENRLKNKNIQNSDISTKNVENINDIEKDINNKNSSTNTSDVSDITKDKTIPNKDKITNYNNTYKNMTDTKQYIALLKTNYGNIEIELDQINTPNTVKNFIDLANSGFYNGVRFHRIIDGFMIQGGDPLSKDISKKSIWGTGGPGYTFADEIKPTNKNNIGTISMANAGPNTNGSQFFINVANNNFLDSKHTVFGKIISGMDIVDKIKVVAKDSTDKPLEDVIIESVSIR